MRPILLALPFVLAACGGQEAAGNAQAAAPAATGAENGKPFVATPVADLDEPWAMTFLPDGRLLVTEQKGAIRLLRVDGKEADAAAIAVEGAPKVAYGGQGGLGDIVLSPDFATDGMVYLSWAEAGEGDTRGAVVGRGKLILPDANHARIEGLQVIWRQQPKVDGRGHYSHRIVFSPDGRYMFVSSGERQHFTPAQDMKQNLGKILRLTPTGAIPADNPFHDQGGVAAQVWSLGHRNILGLAFAPDGTLWENEMGPKGGDELNRVERGSNYGYPIVSNGDHYDGKPIPDHDTRPEFNAPEITWTPVISPSSLIFYTGSMFPEWKGDALIGGLSGQALVRVEVDGTTAREAARYPMGARIREVEQGPDGAIWLLEDEGDGSKGRLLKLTPAR